MRSSFELFQFNRPVKLHLANLNNRHLFVEETIILLMCVVNCALNGFFIKSPSILFLSTCTRFDDAIKVSDR